ncbi:hypothetical protein IPA_00095 [Ignicoccus pacificus DSM 13166]|uniref:Flippase-like domain-containing protein n=1 Tax=Ignicoccus pacificus DSM 13166 TaxID=940294 RepID=A0A977KAD2_9CREN|nr:hypothetical protein IPA_00095 [Ignicoccus pacificus DSM 13166]
MWKKLLLGMILTALILWVYIKVTNVNITVLFKLPPYVIAASVIFMFLADFVRSIRLKILSEYVKAPLSFKESFIIWEASRLLAIMTPGFYGGELLRIGYIAKKYDLSKAIAINILELTSESVGLGINAVTAFTLLLLLRPPNVTIDPLVFPTLIALGISSFGIAVTFTRKCPQRFGHRVYKMCKSIVEALSTAGINAFGIAVLISTIGVALYSFSFGVISSYLVHRGVLGTLIFVCSLPITAFPITPGGIGLPEAIATLSLPALASSLATWRILNLLTVSTMSITTTVLGGLLNVNIRNIQVSKAEEP